MAVSMKLWNIEDDRLRQIHRTRLDYEERLEEWITREPSFLGIDVLLIGRQVTTEFGGKIDLLGINRQGDLVVIELKRDKTPRQIVAQVLDYASWVRKLTYDEIGNIAADYLDRSLVVAFSERFEDPLPDNIDKNHSMLIVASSLDDTSERIVQYLTDEYKVNINVAFFTFFGRGGQAYLGRAWLQDPEQVQEVSDSRTKGPWTFGS
ncbi:MAG: endonuclease NucS [Chloroflexota bacterium]|nr:endonuclease NucS [Chloroflexota bacterium]